MKLFAGMNALMRRKVIIGCSVLALIGFGILGIYAIQKSGAATPFIASESEAGTVNTPATSLADSTASGGRAVKFGTGSNGFIHPGILVNKAQLDFVKAKIAAGAEPWTSSLAKARTTKSGHTYNSGLPFASLNWTPNPVPIVICTQPTTGTGCPAHLDDAMAAYTDALIYYYTGDRAYARKSIEIMNAWSGTLVDIRWDFNGANTSPNGLLQAAWGGEVWPRAAEIIKHTYTPDMGETAFDSSRFATMLRTAYLPHVIDGDGWKGGSVNWLQSMEEAIMNIAIFTDDRASYDIAVNKWTAEVPASIYMAGDTNKFLGPGVPIASPASIYDTSTTTAASLKTFWYNPNSYVSGLQGETCREPNHSAMGFGAMLNTAETARIQGTDLYSRHRDRIVKAMEINTGWINTALAGTNPPVGWVCPNKMDITIGAWALTWEVGYNHYALRNGVNMPNTKALIDRNRASGFKSSTHMINETLTHNGTP